MKGRALVSLHSRTKMAPRVGIAPTFQVFQTRANLPQLPWESPERGTFDLLENGAPGRNLTCDISLRKAALYN